MTSEQIDAMTPEALRIAVAEVNGITWQEGEEPMYGGQYLARGYWEGGKFYREELPDYCNSHDALASVLAKLTHFQSNLYVQAIDHALNGPLRTLAFKNVEVFAIATATPEQICRALLKALL